MSLEVVRGVVHHSFSSVDACNARVSTTIQETDGIGQFGEESVDMYAVVTDMCARPPKLVNVHLGFSKVAISASLMSCSGSR